MKDLKNSQDLATSLAPAALRTTSGNGTGVDLAGFNGAIVAFIVGAITDGTHTPSVEESDASGSGYAAVAAADLIGTLAALAANTNQRVGYKGTKRYVRAVVTVTGSPSTGGYYSAVVVRGAPQKNPVT